MEKKVDDDILFFANLSSIYKSLVHSAVEPVVVPSEPTNSKWVDIFSHCYYDVHEDEEWALDIMKKRIESSPPDIIRHYTFHQGAEEAFSDIRESINNNNRRSIANSTDILCSNLTMLNELVAEHKSRLGGDSFLNHTTCLSGHLFYALGTNYTIELDFNPDQSHLGAIGRIQETRDLVEDFRIRYQRLDGAILSGEEFYNGEKTSDSLYGRMDINKELLKSAGCDLSLLT